MQVPPEIRQQIEMEASELAIGESLGGGLCPFCQGGQSAERKFSITRTDDGLLFNCYRASCSDGRGFIPTAGYLLSGPPAKSRQTPWKGPYRGDFLVLQESDREYFRKRFDLTLLPNSFVGRNSLNQYVMEIRTVDGYVRGYLVRRGGWTPGDVGVVCPRSVAADGPKARLFLNSQDDISLSWHIPSGADQPGRVVIVEDQVSAAKVAQAGVIGVALTGAYLGEDKVRELSLVRPRRVTIALDADATGEAFKHARKWGLAFPRVEVLVLTQDIKDMNRTKVKELLK